MLPFDKNNLRPRRLLSDTRAQSLVEVSLITPLLLLGLYVAVDFGILFFTAQYTQNAVREGARIAAILADCAVDGAVPCASTITESCPGTNTVVQETCSRLTNRLTGTAVAVTLTGTYYPATCMREVKVSASGTYPFGFYRVISLFGMPLPASMSITRAAGARYQGQPVTVTGAC